MAHNFINCKNSPQIESTSMKGCVCVHHHQLNLAYVTKHQKQRPSTTPTTTTTRENIALLECFSFYMCFVIFISTIWVVVLKYGRFSVNFFRCTVCVCVCNGVEKTTMTTTATTKYTHKKYTYSEIGEKIYNGTRDSTT